jgi:D-glycero-alpha-D-manno-heptose-7-phosphate kinase
MSHKLPHCESINRPATLRQIFRARAPLRLGLGGGGTDVSPFSEEQGGYVINATIDLYAQAILEPSEDGQIIFSADDINEIIQVEAVTALPDVEPLRLHRGVYNRIIRQFNDGKPLSFRLTTFADAPAGSGLGTSSTMVVCIIQVFSEWLNLGLSEYEIAHLAYEIEREELLLAGGKQDQYAATFGGFNFIEFGPGPDRILVNPLRIKDWVRNELEASTILFYTGQSRESTKIIEQQIESSKFKHSASYDAMFALKADALLIKEALLRGDFNQYADTLRKTWCSKKKLAANISNPFLNAIYDDAIEAGAEAGKLSGAGGGGFFMFYVVPKKRMAVLRKLQKHHGQIINFHFTNIGAQSWMQAS